MESPVIQTRTIFPSAARTTSGDTASATQSDDNHPRVGGHFIFRVTAIGAAPSVVPRIEAFDPLSQVWYTLLTGVALTAIGTQVLKVFPGITAAANASAADFLPPIWRVVMNAANTDSITYSVAATMR